MSVLNVNIRTFNSRAESPKLYLVFCASHILSVLVRTGKQLQKLPHLPLFHLPTHGHSAAQPRASCSSEEGLEETHGFALVPFLFRHTGRTGVREKDLTGLFAGRVSGPPLLTSAGDASSRAEGKPPEVARGPAHPAVGVPLLCFTCFRNPQNPHAPWGLRSCVHGARWLTPVLCLMQ